MITPYLLLLLGLSLFSTGSAMELWPPAGYLLTVPGTVIVIIASTTAIATIYR